MNNRTCELLSVQVKRLGGKFSALIQKSGSDFKELCVRRINGEETEQIVPFKTQHLCNISFIKLDLFLCRLMLKTSF